MHDSTLTKAENGSEANNPRFPHHVDTVRKTAVNRGLLKTTHGTRPKEHEDRTHHDHLDKLIHESV